MPYKVEVLICNDSLSEQNGVSERSELWRGLYEIIGTRTRVVQVKGENTYHNIILFVKIVSNDIAS